VQHIAEALEQHRRVDRYREAFLVGRARLARDWQSALDRSREQSHVPRADVRGRSVGPARATPAACRRLGATASTARRSTTTSSTADSASLRRRGRPRACCQIRWATTACTFTSTGRSRTKAGGRASRQGAASSRTVRS
jgi:hypothetical protein